MMRESHEQSGTRKQKKAAHLIVESTLGLEVLEEFAIRLTTPEVHVRDLEVTPDCTIDCKETMIMTN